MGVAPATLILSMPGRIDQAHPATTPSTARLITIAHPVLILTKTGAFERSILELMTVIMAVTTHAFHTKEERLLIMLSKMEVTTKATCGSGWMNWQCQGGAMLRTPSGLIKSSPTAIRGRLWDSC